MASYNKVILMGNLTRDPELRYTATGTAVAKLGLAVNRRYKTAAGEQREETTFVDCTAWTRAAEVLCEYKRKGDPLLIDGRLQYSTWEDRETGQKRSKLEVVIENFQFLSRAGSADSGGSAGGSRPVSGGRSDDMEPLADDDIPF